MYICATTITLKGQEEGVYHIQGPRDDPPRDITINIIKGHLILSLQAFLVSSIRFRNTIGSKELWCSVLASTCLNSIRLLTFQSSNLSTQSRRHHKTAGG